jgi:hypothetical protein
MKGKDSGLAKQDKTTSRVVFLINWRIFTSTQNIFKKP